MIETKYGNATLNNNGKIYHKHISRVNLEDLEKEVKKQGFEWKKLDGDI